MKIQFAKHVYPLALITIFLFCISSCAEEEVPEFSVPGPVLSKVKPDVGEAGTEVVISGSNFSAAISDNAVSFNGVAAVVTSARAGELTTTVPDGATSGAITVTVNGATATDLNFTVTLPPPVITSVTPSSAKEGDEVVISGSGFSATASENVIKFNGRQAEVVTASTTSVTVLVPEGATDGPITAAIGIGGASTGPDFVVLGGAIALTIAIDSEADDAEEIIVIDDSGGVVGEVDLGSSDLEIGEVSNNQGLMTIGLRFNNVTIPQGATIATCSIQFQCDRNGSNDVEVTLFGENVGDSAPFEETPSNITSRSTTMVSEVWSIPEWVEVGDRGEAQRSVDISSIIQEIVSRSDWASGNSLSIIMVPTGISASATSTSGGREAETFNDGGDNDDVAEITFEYLPN